MTVICSLYGSASSVPVAVPFGDSLLMSRGVTHLARRPLASEALVTPQTTSTTANAIANTCPVNQSVRLHDQLVYSILLRGISGFNRRGAEDHATTQAFIPTVVVNSVVLVGGAVDDSVNRDSSHGGVCFVAGRDVLRSGVRSMMKINLKSL